MKPPTTSPTERTLWRAVGASTARLEAQGVMLPTALRFPDVRTRAYFEQGRKLAGPVSNIGSQGT